MVTREQIADRLSELTPEDLDALNEYLDRLQEAGDDPVRRAFVRASWLPPEKVSAADREAIDEALEDDSYFARDELDFGEATA